MIKHIPIVCFSEIKIIPYELHTLESAAQNIYLAFNQGIRWFNGVPYRVTVINKKENNA